MTNEEIKNELRRGLTLTKLQRGLALTVKESRDLYKYIEALEQPCENAEELSDGYHTFNQLYHQRAVLFACIVKQNKNKAWKSFKHSDGNYCFDSNGEWFIVGVDTPQGSYTYHFAKEYWDMFDCQELECGKEWDGHSEEDVTRLLSLEQQYCDDCISREATIDLVADYDLSMDQVVRGIHALPPVTPSRPKGHWINHREHCEKLGLKPSGLGAYEWCSNCDCGIDVKEFHRIHYNFCPICGADMQEAENEEGKNRKFKILIKDTETYIKVTKRMDKEGIRWVSDGKFASDSKKYRHISNYFPIYLLVDKYNRLSWNPDPIGEEYEITPEEYLKNIH